MFWILQEERETKADISVSWVIFNSIYILDYFLSKPMFPIFLQLPKKGLRPKWTIYKHVSDKSKKCLSVGNFGILSVVCSL